MDGTVDLGGPYNIFPLCKIHKARCGWMECVGRSFNFPCGRLHPVKIRLCSAGGNQFKPFVRCKKEGCSAVEQHHSQTWYTEVVPAIKKNFPGADCGFFWFGEEAGNVTSMTITHGAMADSAPHRSTGFSLSRNLFVQHPEQY